MSATKENKVCACTGPCLPCPSKPGKIQRAQGFGESQPGAWQTNGTVGGDQKMGEEGSSGLPEEDISEAGRSWDQERGQEGSRERETAGDSSSQKSTKSKVQSGLVDILPPTSWWQVGDEGLGKGVVWEGRGAGWELRGLTSAHQPPASCLLMTKLREEDVETPPAPAEPPTRAPLLLLPKRRHAPLQSFLKGPSINLGASRRQDLTRSCPHPPTA